VDGEAGLGRRSSVRRRWTAAAVDDRCWLAGWLCGVRSADSPTAGSTEHKGCGLERGVLVSARLLPSHDHIPDEWPAVSE